MSRFRRLPVGNRVITTQMPNATGPTSIHFMDPIDDAVNAAQLHSPSGTTELLGTVGALEDVLKGLAYIMGSAEYGYRAVATAAEGLSYRTYPGEGNVEPDEAKAELLQLLADVRANLESHVLPAVGRAAHIAARLQLTDAPTFSA